MNPFLLRKRWLKPAGQAMEAHLYGIVPADGRTAYPGTAARNAIVSMTGGEPGTVVAFIKSGVGRKEVQMGNSSSGKKVNGAEMPNLVLKAQKGTSADGKIELSLLLTKWTG